MPQCHHAKGQSLFLEIGATKCASKFVFCAPYVWSCRSHHHVRLCRHRSSIARSWRQRARRVVDGVAVCDGANPGMVGDGRDWSIRNATTRRRHYLPVYRGRGHDAASGCRTRYGVRVHRGRAGLPRRVDDWMARVTGCYTPPSITASALKSGWRTGGSAQVTARTRRRTRRVQRFQRRSRTMRWR